MLSFGCLCVLLGFGYWLRRRLVFLQRLYLPASVIAGLVGLLIFQLVRVPSEVSRGWNQLPGLLINVVFACLFLGVTLPTVSKVWKSSGRQLAYGQIVAWGQYAVGCTLVLLLLGPIFGLPDIFAGIMPVGFEGGHGTAGGMGPVFDALGFPEIKDYALASATGGIIGAIIVGMGLVNWIMNLADSGMSMVTMMDTDAGLTLFLLGVDTGETPAKDTDPDPMSDLELEEIFAPSDEDAAQGIERGFIEIQGRKTPWMYGQHNSDQPFLQGFSDQQNLQTFVDLTEGGQVLLLVVGRIPTAQEQGEPKGRVTDAELQTLLAPFKVWERP
jgi:hypothetical protein